jgi:hypothetical protein
VNQLSKVIIAATMIGSFSLLWLMGDLQRKISSLEGQLNPQQPTYSPSVSEPSPSPTSTPTITIEREHLTFVTPKSGFYVKLF